MAQDWQAFPSAVSTAVNSCVRTLVEPFESLGTPIDAAATDVTAENSIFALLRGTLSELGVVAGSGDATVNISPRVFVSPIATLGSGTDAAAPDLTGAHSGIALAKRALSLAGL